MPRKSQANLKTVELIDRVFVDEIEERDEEQEILEKKIRMWTKAWISEHIDPDPETRISYTVNLHRRDDAMFPVACYIQIYCNDGFLQGLEIGKDTRQAVKRTLKGLVKKLNDIRTPQKMIILPFGQQAQLAS